MKFSSLYIGCNQTDLKTMKTSLSGMFGNGGDSDSDEDAGPLFSKKRKAQLAAAKPKIALAKPIRKLGDARA